MIKIRYHHLMCIPRYRGEGYSAEFCDNLQKIKAGFRGCAAVSRNKKEIDYDISK